LSESVSNFLPLACGCGFSAYDAGYLELSIRHGVPLATVDAKLREAAQRAGVKIFGKETA
jgi:predicted nucleic acid-binding protein